MGEIGRLAFEDENMIRSDGDANVRGGQVRSNSNSSDSLIRSKLDTNLSLSLSLSLSL